LRLNFSTKTINIQIKLARNSKWISFDIEEWWKNAWEIGNSVMGKTLPNSSNSLIN